MGEDKHMVANTGYEITNSITVGGREMVIAVNDRAADGNFYMYAEYTQNGFIGQYENVAYSAEYLAILRTFTEGIERQAVALETEFSRTAFQAEIITADQCHPHDYGQDLNGQVIAIKSSALSPEYRRGDVQLVYVTGGNGANGNARGRVVFCRHLSNGEQVRFERHDVLGIVKDIPSWAQKQLAVLRIEREPQEPQSEEKVGGYTIIKTMTVGKTRFVLGENPGAPAPFVTWQQQEGSGRGYDLGHYFTDYDKADADLTNRADDARENITLNKGFRPKNRDDAR